MERAGVSGCWGRGERDVGRRGASFRAGAPSGRRLLCNRAMQSWGEELTLFVLQTGDISPGERNPSASCQVGPLSSTAVCPRPSQISGCPPWHSTSHPSSEIQAIRTPALARIQSRVWDCTREPLGECHRHDDAGASWRASARGLERRRGAADAGALLPRPTDCPGPGQLACADTRARERVREVGRHQRLGRPRAAAQAYPR